MILWLCRLVRLSHRALIDHQALTKLIIKGLSLRERRKE